MASSYRKGDVTAGDHALVCMGRLAYGLSLNLKGVVVCLHSLTTRKLINGALLE